MHHRARMIPALALGIAIAACSSSTAPTTLAGRLTGTWSESGLSAGSSFVMTLSAHDTTVTGTGQYAIEAGRSGTVTVTGVIEAPNILLTVTYDYGPVAHYSAALQGSTTLTGAWFTTSDPIELTFEKVR